MFKKLRTIIYHVDDIEKAAQWYTQVTGIAPYFVEPFYVGFDINGYELGLDPNPTFASPGNNQSVAYWAVDNIRDVVKQLAAAGAVIQSEVTNVGGPIEVAVVLDPFGNAVGLIEGA